MSKNKFHLHYLKQLKESVLIQENHKKIVYLSLFLSWVSVIFLFFSKWPVVASIIFSVIFIIHGFLLGMDSVFAHQVEERITRIPDNEAEISKRRNLAYRVVDDIKAKCPEKNEEDEQIFDGLEESIYPRDIAEAAPGVFKRSGEVLKAELGTETVEPPILAESLFCNPWEKKNILGKNTIAQWEKHYTSDCWKPTMRQEVISLLRKDHEQIEDYVDAINDDTYTENSRIQWHQAWKKVLGPANQ